jgi:hypothetical protein
MKIYEYIRGENDRTIKLFGCPIMEQTSDYMTSIRTQKFLGGIVTTSRVNNLQNCSFDKEIKVLNFPFLRRYEQDNYKTYSILGKTIRKVSLLNSFKREYFKYFDKKYDDIYILRANSGEIYLILAYLIDAYIKKNGSKNPLLVATNKYHVDIIKMICPDIPYVYVKKWKFNITSNIFKIDNFRFFLLFKFSYFKQVELDIKENPLGQHHYFKSILNKLELTENDISMRKMVVPPEDERSMLDKIAKTGLNINNFVFLAPEAQSCKLYDEDFWVELINRFQEKGIDVFVNLTKNDIKLKGAKDYKTCGLTFSEAFALAKHSKRIVSLRSGFTEFLLQTGVPTDVLYTKFRHRHFFDDMDVYQVMSGFGISQIPFVDKSKVRAFNTFEISQKECLEEILEGCNNYNYEVL